MEAVPSLPPEILCQICVFLPLSDLKNTRLASKLLETCVSSYLFEVIYIDVLPESFERLLSISAIPKFACGVRSVFFEPRIFRSVCSLDRFRDKYSEYRDLVHDDKLAKYSLPENAPEFRNISDEAWCRYYASHIAICKVQRQLQQNSTIDSVLIQSFRKFPNLKNIFMGHLMYPYYTADVGSPRLFYSRAMTRTIKQVLIPPYHHQIVPGRHLASILTAAGHAATKLRKIHVANLHRRFFDTPILTFNNPLRLCLASVQSLRMQIRLSRDPYSDWMENLDSFIQQCPSLQELIIMPDGEVSVPTPVFGKKEWRFIHKVSISKVALVEDEIIDFIGNHKSSLSLLALSHCSLLVGEWSSVFSRVKQFFHDYVVVAEDDRLLLLRDRTGHLEEGRSDFQLILDGD